MFWISVIVIIGIVILCLILILSTLDRIFKEIWKAISTIQSEIGKISKKECPGCGCYCLRTEKKYCRSIERDGTDIDRYGEGSWDYTEIEVRYRDDIYQIHKTCSICEYSEVKEETESTIISN